MTTERKVALITIAFLIVIAVVSRYWSPFDKSEEFTIERDVITEETSRPPLLVDDKLSDKKPVFDPALVDSRSLQTEQTFWVINSSDAIINLDIGNTLKTEEPLNRLYPHYRAAAEALQDQSRITPLLPSVNLLSAKAKQFDDGLMAALMVALNSATAPPPDSPLAVLLVLHQTLPQGSEAHAWVSAALHLAETPKITLNPIAQKLRDNFLASPEAEPLSFYAWSKDLQRIWRATRFIQQRLSSTVITDLRKNLAASPSLLASYQRMLSAQAGLNNPAWLDTLDKPDGRYFLSPMQAKETVLFTKLFGTSGLPAGVDLMEEFIKAIRSGRVDLAPRADSGWYDYQVFALETFLLPERGPENQKLLLTRKYKERLVEAFRAILTKQRETHEVNMPVAATALEVYEIPRISPRLRLEPNPTSYLRLARSYAFLENLLPTLLPEAQLKSLKGLKENGPRALPLMEELATMKNLFYGFHLLACEDIGLKPSLLPGEAADPRTLMDLASNYLTSWQKDSDLAVDTRIATPVFEGEKHYRHWCVLGVRPVKLEARYATNPKGQPSNEAGPDKPWITLAYGSTVTYLLLVDEFSEANSPTTLTRATLRKICDQHKDKAAILKGLAKAK
ncbi:MAG TPA: hypothetical protein VGH19_07060 [Verrucomicrobiae bacterium]